MRRLAETPLRIEAGEFRCLAFGADDGGPTHLALVAGDVARHDVLVRVHSECLTGDVLRSRHCDCGEQLERSLHAVAAAGAGVVVYLRGHEGRGIGLADKLRAYVLQEEGLDTVEANLALGLPVDAREYRAAAAVLLDLGVRSVRLLTNNPAKVEGLLAAGVPVRRRIPLVVPPNSDNRRYLATKRERLGHAA